MKSQAQTLLISKPSALNPKLLNVSLIAGRGAGVNLRDADVKLECQVPKS